ncbi:hypothetical protein OIU84_027716 [Salix udensis]|uniref:Uncharacterized protein n=1 Tax=Salix udensis TaxID=889485 RepID=A0AAD6KI44_9ROSI|nr:hypothetical protein OIU84_027716 [Salix udensis]
MSSGSVEESALQSACCQLSSSKPCSTGTLITSDCTFEAKIEGSGEEAGSISFSVTESSTRLTVQGSDFKYSTARSSRTAFSPLSSDNMASDSVSELKLSSLYPT